MKVVIVNTSERTGGAAVAANRLTQALLKAQVDVTMLVRDRKTDNPAVQTINTSWFRKLINQFYFLWERIVIFLNNKLDRTNLFRVSIANVGMDIRKLKLIQEADIIHLHWINQGMLSIRDIRLLLATGKPVVWTMHDLWPATGICHYPGSCKKYRTQCKSCVLTPEAILDFSKLIAQRKQASGFNKITYVGCSKWIAGLAGMSSLLKRAQISAIPNPIDTSVYYPADKKQARMFYQLNEDKIYLLFVAVNVLDRRKGAMYFKEACEYFSSDYPELKDKIEILLIGNASDEIKTYFPYPVRGLGYLHTDTELRMAYSAATLFIIPSLEDNLPNTIMESMACGTPCVGFAIGGIPEMIGHCRSGYVAQYKSAEDMASGIAYLLKDHVYEECVAGCIEKVTTCYSEQIVASSYIELYNKLIKENEYTKTI